MAALVLVLALIAHDRGKDNQRKTRSARTTAPVDVMNLPVRELASQEIARLNLSCAAGLAGAEQVDLDRCLGELEQMAAKVQSETERHFYRFRRAPAEFENSESFFRMLMLTVVLAEDFNTSHNLDCLPGCIAGVLTGAVCNPSRRRGAFTPLLGSGVISQRGALLRSNALANLRTYLRRSGKSGHGLPFC